MLLSTAFVRNYHFSNVSIKRQVMSNEMFKLFNGFFKSFIFECFKEFQGESCEFKSPWILI